MHLAGSYETPTPDTTYKTLTLSTTFHAFNGYCITSSKPKQIVYRTV